ncbi:MAG: putative sulfate exporter family transporter [Cyclobacteriaceae bacterium]|nr:putative sulfate exporter family transporter [Cyclobacteriaceae bacterium]
MKKPILTEDWLSLVVGFVLIGFAIVFQFALPKFGWNDSSTMVKILSSQNVMAMTLLFVVVLCVGLTIHFLGGKRTGELAGGILFLFLISVIAQFFAGYKPLKDVGLEYVIFALVLGIAIRSVVGVPGWLKESLQSEFFIKTGLVLLGASIIFNDVVKAGSLGLIQALVVVLVVWYFAYWLAKKLKIDDELGIMISSAVSICGVSAAIATCGAIQGDSKKLSYVVSLVLLVALPMMIFMPPLAKLLHLDPAVAGAWIGGTIDTTGAVVATGAQLGEEALNVSTIVKLSQNVLLGIAAVAISFFWMMKEKKTERNKPNWRLIWERFPKFVLGFIGASLLFSFVLSSEQVAASKDFIKGIQTALFALAFVSIGLETDLSALMKTGNGRPALVFILAQVFNVLITLAIAYLLFSRV